MKFTNDSFLKEFLKYSDYNVFGTEMFFPHGEEKKSRKNRVRFLSIQPPVIDAEIVKLTFVIEFQY